MESTPASIFEFTTEVVETDIDELNHVSNLVYLKWTLKAAVAHSTAVGWTPHKYHQLGAGFIVRSHSIKYRRPAMLGDKILIQTWIAGFERVSSLRKYEIRDRESKQLLAQAETNWVYVDFADLSLRKIPAELQNAFRAT